MRVVLADVVDVVSSSVEEVDSVVDVVSEVDCDVEEVVVVVSGAAVVVVEANC